MEMLSLKGCKEATRPNHGKIHFNQRVTKIREIQEMVFVRFFPKIYQHFGLSEGMLRYEGQNHEGPYMSYIGA